MLMNENGDVTRYPTQGILLHIALRSLTVSRHHSHLMGFFFRTLRMVDHGIKPMYVFDGKPPELKGGVVSHGPYRQGIFATGGLIVSRPRTAGEAVRRKECCSRSRVGSQGSR